MISRRAVVVVSQGVSVLAFCSDHPSSNPVNDFSVKLLLKERK